MEACEYIQSIPKFTEKTDLENTRILLERLAHPEKKYLSIHIAGTNGKGSVAKMTALMLQNAGYRTGLFISPHLVRINERISINGEEISDGILAECFERIRAVCKGLQAEDPGKEKFRHPAYFEFLFAMAADHFAKEGCDFVVWETGLGGRLDATNTITPVVSVITSIGMDHMQYLGNSIEKIAGEKAGIIKEKVPVVCNTGDDRADAVIESTAGSKNSEMLTIRMDPQNKAVSIRSSVAGETELPSKIREVIEEFAASQKALYQRDNAYTACTAFLKAMDILGQKEAAGEAVAAALRDFTWEGRMEEILPGVIIDGAHNEDAAKRFAETARKLTGDGPWKKLSLLFAVCEDKDYESIIQTICLNLKLEDVYVTELSSARKTDAALIRGLFQKYRPAGEHWNTYATTNLQKAWETALGEKDDDTLLMVLGSLYLVGEIKGYLERK